MGIADTWGGMSMSLRYLKLYSGCSFHEGRKMAIQIGIEIKGLTLKFKVREAIQTQSSSCIGEGCICLQVTEYSIKRSLDEYRLFSHKKYRHRRLLV